MLSIRTFITTTFKATVHTGYTGIYDASFLFSGWGTHFIDFDNDGWKDIFVAQSHVLDNVTLDYPEISYQQPLLLLKNIEGIFIDISAHGRG